MDRIEDTDRIMASFLGINVEHRRVRRFWAAIASFFEGLGSVIPGIVSVFSSGSNHYDMSVYNEQLSVLKSGQMELNNKLDLQTTVFMADAEKKKLQIEWLQKTQDDIQNKIQSLEQNVLEDSAEKTKQIKQLTDLLSETQNKLKEHEQVQKQLTNKVEKIEETLLGVDKKLQALNNTLLEHDKMLNQTSLALELESITMDFSFLYNHFESEQKTLFYVIRRAKRGELDPYVLTPLNLIEMLQNIIPNLDENEKFPLYPNIDNARNLYNLITPSVNFFNNTLIFILKMPLVNTKSFDFYKITSLPVSIAKNIFAFILPKNPFLLVDKFFHEYLAIPFQEYVDFCKAIDKSIFLCKQTQPIYSVASEKNCEVELLMGNKQILETCNKRVIFLKEPLFLQLQEIKSWIYVAPEEHTPVMLNCEVQNLLSVEGTGFIHIPNKCKLRYNHLAIESVTEFTKPVLSNYTPSANISNFIFVPDVDKLKERNQKISANIILPFDLEKLAEISVAAIITKNNNYLYFLFLLPVAVILIAVFLFSKKSKKTKLFISKSLKRVRNRIARVPLPQHSSVEGKAEIQPSTAKTVEGLNRNDSDCEYLTVRVKVNKNPGNQSIEIKPAKFVNEGLPKAGIHKATAPQIVEYPEDDIYGNTDVVVEHNYLNKIRKLKPTMIH